MPSLITSDNGVSSGSAGLKTTAASDGALVLQTSTSGGTATNAVYIDTAQNVGVGVTPSAWGGGFKAFEGAGFAAAWSDAVSFHLVSNAYRDGSGWVYKNNGFSTRYRQLNGEHNFFTAASGTAGNAITFTQAMTLDSSGNLGVGTTSPLTRLHAMSSASSVAFALSPNSSNTNIGYLINDATYISFGSSVGSTGVKFRVALAAPDNAATIDSSGNLLVGSTSAAWNIGGAIQCKGITSHAGQNGAFQNNGINLEWRAGALRIWVDTTDLGTVQFASDYRLKKDVQTQTITALDRIEQVRPVTFEFGDYGDLFKGDGVAREGFIAHELAEVIPSAVDGEKDCENQIQTLRLDALCSVMVKAIQELNAKVDAQAAEIAALKGN